jgi:hypothetical protein
MNKSEAILTQTVEQLERMNEALAALRRELLPGQPKKFGDAAERQLHSVDDRQSVYQQFDGPRWILLRWRGEP